MRAAWRWLGVMLAVACGGLAVACGGPSGGREPDADLRADVRAEAAVDADQGSEGIEPSPEPAEGPEVSSDHALDALEPQPDTTPDTADAAPELDDVVTPPEPTEGLAEPAEVLPDAPHDTPHVDDAADDPAEALGELGDACPADGACAGCVSSTDCDDGLPCTADACVAGECRHEALGTCCTEATGCDDANACTTEACVDGLCQRAFTGDPACCSDGWLADAAWSFEASLPPGATVEGPAGSLVRWSTSAVAASDGASSLWFGDPASGTYENPSGPAGQCQVATGTLTLPAIDLPAAGTVYAAFDLRLDTEWGEYNAATWELPGPDLAFDELTLLANGLPVWTSLVYEIAGSTCRYGTCSFKPVEVSLGAFAGQSVVLAFRFDSKTPVANGYAGPFVDRLRLGWACAPLDCFSSLECDDAKDALDVCTRDKCLERQCVFERTGYPGVACCYPVDQTFVTFEADASAVAVESTDPVTWHAITTSAGGKAHNSLGSLYLGDPGTHTYAAPDGGPVAAEAVWTLDVPPFEGYVLEWWQWLDLRDAADPARDTFTVTVRATGASDAGQIVFSNKPLYGYPVTWRRVSTPLDPWQGGTIEVVLRFDSGDGEANDGEGIYVDDLTFFYGCD
jgi:hypothetical protein